MRPSPLTLASLALLLQAGYFPGGQLLAQEPDSLRRPAPPAAEVPDSLQVPDSTRAASDTVGPDSLTVARFPAFPDPASRRPGLAAEWKQRDLMATGSLSFADLLEFTPSLDPVRAGFLDGPQSSVFAGSGAGGFRYDIDGYEYAPLLGGAVDLHQIPLVELQQARMVRVPGGYRAIGHAYRRDRTEPYSRIEGGTGDKDTNLLRGFFSSRLFGAPFGFGFDRIDTRGQVAGADRSFAWFDLAVPLPASIWGELEYRSTTVKRDTFPDISRSDWVFRLRREFKGGWFADVVAGSASIDRDVDEPDSLTATLRAADARQVTVRGAKTGRNWQAYVSLRGWDGEGVPSFTPEASLEVTLGPASLYAIGNYSDWGEFSTAGGYASVALDLPLNIRVLGEIEEGDQGMYSGVPKPRFQYGRWTAGAELTVLGDYKLGGRAGRSRVERSLGIGPPVDSISLPGGTVGVTEAWVTGPVSRLFGGVLELGARYRSHEDGLFLYWPKWDWRVEGEYRVLALRDQLQVWLKGIGGVRGPMYVPDASLGPGAARNTSNLNYFHVEAVVRIRDVYIYYNYEYFDSLGDPRDVESIRLPTARYHFGLKWEFWN